MNPPTSHRLEAAKVSALQVVNSIPRRENEPVFNAPWEAEIFALCLSLFEQGLFTWKEWADLLSRNILAAPQEGDPDLGDTYYQHWLKTLEQLVVEKQLGNAEELGELYRAWDKAARSTMHGEPIALAGCGPSTV